MIVDSHCHLNYFSHDEIKSVVARAKENKVMLMQTICTTIKEYDKLLEIANTYNNVYLSVGVHPINSAQGEFISFKELTKLTRHEKVIGIGETGLDLYKCDQLMPQKNSFLEHIKCSRETKLPIIIHSRNADKEMMEILECEIKEGSFSGLMHCFTSSKELAMKAIELGLYISFSGIVTFKNAKIIKEVANLVPKDKVLVETDSPFLCPEPYRGQKNEPAMVKYVVECLAELWNKSANEVSSITTDNFFRLFKKCSKFKYDEL